MEGVREGHLAEIGLICCGIQPKFMTGVFGEFCYFVALGYHFETWNACVEKFATFGEHNGGLRHTYLSFISLFLINSNDLRLCSFYTMQKSQITTEVTYSKNAIPPSTTKIAQSVSWGM